MTAPGRSSIWIENEAPTGALPRLRLDQVWRNRELIYFFALRDVKVRYKQAFLGVAWAGLQPIVGALMFTVLFNNLADVPLPGRSYYAFALVGFSAWTYYATSVAAGGSSVLYNAELVTKVALPPIVPPIAALLPGLIDVAVGLTIALMVALVAGDDVSALRLVVALPAGLLLLIASATAPALFFGAVIVRYRDMAVALTFGLQVLLFASPVAYPPELLPGSWETIAYLNPVTGAIGLLRAGLTGAAMPGAGRLMISVAAAIVVLAGGLVHFRRNEREFADII